MPATGTAASPAGEGRRWQFRAGDGIRGLASLMVVSFHVAYFGATARLPFRDLYGPVIGALISHFDLAVYPFFVLSGYLVGRGFVHRFLTSGAYPSLDAYAIRRLCRVLPAFWIGFSLLLIWFGTLHASAWGIASVYLFSQNYHASTVAFLVGPAWTLDIEAVFYATLPLGFLALSTAAGTRCDRRGRLIVLLASLTVLTAASVACRPLLPQTVNWQVSFPAMLLCFTPGIALAALEPDARRLLVQAGGAARRVRIGVAVGAVALTVLYFTGSQNGLAPAHFGIEPDLGAAVGALWVGAALVWEWSVTGVLFPFNSRVLAWIGERSYSLYVIHTGVLFELIRWRVAVHHPLHRFVVLELCTIVLSLAAATVMWHLVERPGMALGHRLSRGIGMSPIVAEGV